MLKSCSSKIAIVLDEFSIRYSLYFLSLPLIIHIQSLNQNVTEAMEKVQKVQIRLLDLVKVEETNNTANLNFLFLSCCVYLFKTCPSQFLSHWELAEPVFCSEELSCLPYKNQNQSLTFSSLAGKFKFAVW